MGIIVKTNYDVRSHDTQVFLYSHRDMFRLRKWLLSQYFKLMGTPKKEREQIVDDLCRHTGVSRKTLYKWKKRYIEESDAGLYDLSRKPKRMHHAPAFIVLTIHDMRERFGWGD